MARTGILGVLALASVLAGCAEDVPPASPLNPAPEACQRQAQKLGFAVLGSGAPEQQADGSTAYPILVPWGNDGGVHLLCRIGAGGATIG